MKRAQTTAIRSGSKARVVYDRAHVGWRSGALNSWYFGRRSPNDPTIVWLIDGVEFDAKNLGGVTTAIDAAFTRAGIADAMFGDAWCGYRSLHVVFADGSRLTERYDAATGRVVHEHGVVGAIVAASEAA